VRVYEFPAKKETKKKKVPQEKNKKCLSSSGVDAEQKKKVE